MVKFVCGAIFLVDPCPMSILLFTFPKKENKNKASIFFEIIILFNLSFFTKIVILEVHTILTYGDITFLTFTSLISNQNFGA